MRKVVFAQQLKGVYFYRANNIDGKKPFGGTNKGTMTQQMNIASHLGVFEFRIVRLDKLKRSTKHDRPINLHAKLKYRRHNVERKKIINNNHNIIQKPWTGWDVVVASSAYVVGGFNSHLQLIDIRFNVKLNWVTDR